MDLAKLAQEDTAVLILRDPKTLNQLMHDDGKTPVSITVASLDSDKFKTARRAALNKKIENPTVPTAESLEMATVDNFVWATVGWNLIVDGEELPCNEQTSRKLYTDPRFGWVVQQVDQFVSNRSNFIKASAPLS